MEPNTQPSSPSQESLPQEETPIYHTISGGPETLQDIQEEKTQEITHSVQQEGVQTVQMATEQNSVSQAVLNPIVPPTVNQSTGAWSFFDNNPKLSTFLFLFLSNFIITPLAINLEVNFIDFRTIVSIPLIIAIILGIIDFRGKRKEIFIVVVFTVILSAIVSLIFFYLLMSLVTAFFSSAGH